MLKRAVKNVLFKLGYEIRRSRARATETANFTLYKYLNADGTFDYDTYREIQTEGNKTKLNDVWVLEENISFLADYIKAKIGHPKFGICHGTRRGMEQQWFRKYLDCEVIGTEISDTASQFPHTIQWDFHEVKKEWRGAADFIYSNSFDHSYDPEKCLNAWMGCLAQGGLCILEHSSQDETSSASDLDAFGADVVQMAYLIARWGGGEYGVRELVDAPFKKDSLVYLCFIVVQRF